MSRAGKWGGVRVVGLGPDHSVCRGLGVAHSVRLVAVGLVLHGHAFMVAGTQNVGVALGWALLGSV